MEDIDSVKEQQGPAALQRKVSQEPSVIAKSARVVTWPARSREAESGLDPVRRH